MKDLQADLHFDSQDDSQADFAIDCNCSFCLASEQPFQLKANNKVKPMVTSDQSLLVEVCFQDLIKFNALVLSSGSKSVPIPQWLKANHHAFWLMMGLLYEDEEGLSWTLFRSAIVAQNTALCSYLFERAMQSEQNPMICVYYLLTGTGFHSKEDRNLTEVQKYFHIISYIVDRKESEGAFELQVPSAYHHMQQFIASTPVLYEKWLDNLPLRKMRQNLDSREDARMRAFLKLIRKYNNVIREKIKLSLSPTSPPQCFVKKKTLSKQQRKKRRLSNQKNNLKIFIRELIGLNLKSIDLVLSLLVCVQYQSDSEKRTRSSYNPRIVSLLVSDEDEKGDSEKKTRSSYNRSLVQGQFLSHINKFLMIGGSSKILFILANSCYLARQKQLGATESLAYLKTSITECIENDNMSKKYKLSKSERLLLSSMQTVQI